MASSVEAGNNERFDVLTVNSRESPEKKKGEDYTIICLKTPRHTKIQMMAAQTLSSAFPLQQNSKKK